MVSPGHEAVKHNTPAEPKSAETSITGCVDSKKPDCWTAQHEAELKDLAARGEEPRSIIELMETDYPCLQGKLSEEWIKERTKDVQVTG